MARVSNKLIENTLKRVVIDTGINLSIDTWSPGDGWTRYKLVDDQGHEYSVNLTRDQMYEQLHTLDNVLYAMNKNKANKEIES